MLRPLSDIAADLAVAYQARRDAMQASTYNAGGKSVSRNLGEINTTIRTLESELRLAEAKANGRSASPFGRGCVS